MPDNNELLKGILLELKKANKNLELIYHLFAKYDGQALQQLEDLRAAEEPPNKK